MKKTILWIVTGVLIGAIIVSGIGWKLYQNEKANQLTANIQNAFVSEYGQVDGVQLLSISQPEDIYIFYWRNSEATHASMWIDGLWIELASVPNSSSEGK